MILRTLEARSTTDRPAGRGVIVVLLILLILTGSTRARSTAQSTGVVRGIVVDQDGRPVGGARVVMERLTSSGEAVEVETDPDGRFTQPVVLPGFYAVRASKGELGSELYRVRVRDGRTVEISFLLEPGIRVASWIVAERAREELAEVFAAGVAANRDASYADAVTHFTRAVELNPGCVECHFNIGVAYVALDRHADAERAFTDALAIRPDYAAAYYGLSNLYTDWGRPDDARAARDAANRIALASLAAGRQHAAEAVDRGLAFFNAGDLQEARRLFQEAIERSINFGPAHYWLGVTLSDLGQSDSALGAFRRYLSLERNGERAEQALARIAELER